MSYLDEMDAIVAKSSKKENASNSNYLDEMDAIAAKSNNTNTVTQNEQNSASSPSELSYSYGERAGQVARGVPAAVGGIVDLATLPATSGAQLIQPKLAESIEKLSGKKTNPQQIQNTNLAEALPRETVDRLYGKDLSPKDKTGEILQTFGEFLTPMPGSGYATAAKFGGKSLAKALGKEALMAGGASAALHLTPKFTEEGTGARVAEDIGKIAFGSNISGLAAKLGKGVKNLPSSAIAGKAAPNEEVLNLAKEKGIDLPFNVGLNSKKANFLANNYLKSIFSSDKYKEVLKKADQQMVKAVKDSIDTLGEVNLKPSAASAEYRALLKAEEEVMEKKAGQLYGEAGKFLKSSDKVAPKNTAEFIGSLKELLTRDIQSPATKRVAGIVGSLAEKWGIKPAGEPTLRLAGDEIQITEEQMTSLLDAFKKQIPDISLEKLIGVKKELNKLVNYDYDLKGVESYLNGLIGAVGKDIESSSNKAFVSKFKEADEHFRTNVGEKFRKGLGRSLLTGDAPIEAFNKMYSVENIKKLKNIAGESEAGKEIFDALKKAKLREIFKHSFDEGSLQTGRFAKLFTKEEKQAELIKELLGEAEFNKLSEVAKIAEEFSKSGKEFLNTSGTALVSSDLAKAEKVVKGFTNLLSFGGTYSGAGYIVGGPIGAAGGALGTVIQEVGIPNMLSRLVSNPKFVNQMRAYAVAKKAGKEKDAQTILKRILDIVKNSEAEHIGRYSVINQATKDEE